MSAHGPFLVPLLLASIALACGAARPAPAPGGAGPQARATAPPRPDLVLVVIDALRADRLGLLGAPRATTPALDRRLAGGLVFEHATTPIPFTAPSVISLLTGRYPQNHRVRLIFQRLPPEQATVPERLAALGYRTGAVVSNMVLTDEATGLGARFDDYDDFVDQRVRWSGVSERPSYERDARRTTDAALEWLARTAADPGPLFLWLHYMDPHAPYAAPDDRPTDHRHAGTMPVEASRVATASRLAGVTDGLEYVDRYDEEVSFADREVARFLDAWDAVRGLARTVVVLTSDHGETLMEEGRERWFAHGFGVWEEQLRVPLVVRGPGVPAGRRTDAVSLLDIAPTLVELAGGGAVPDLDGRSLLREPAPRELLHEGIGNARGTQLRALRSGALKWVLYTERGVERPERRRLYDLDRDPLEISPLPWQATPAPELLFAALRADPDPSGLPARESILAGRRLTEPKSRPDGLPVVSERADEETRKKLEALGYL